ncbi:MAG: hypothetical protein LUE96_07415 [Lachnospiraceae bacterium]|nr:hypothetical protein [Lachnospiraceae bacterium]
MDDLTKDQKFLIVSLYKIFLSRQSSLDAHSANYFADSDSLIPLLELDFSSEYLADLCLALLERGYIDGYKSECSVDEFKISDKTIIFMQNRFKRGLKDVLVFLSNFI